jgi:hypothetical protein
MVERLEARPPEMIEKLVRALTPPASREHVLGDLNERYVSPRQYLLDALCALPFLIASRLRRTTHPLVFLLAGLFLWWAVFWGGRQHSPLAAAIPTAITLVILALRDVYRDVTPKWGRAVAMDIAIAAAGVLLSQALLALTAPGLMLTRSTLLVGFPLGFVILFFVRLQSPTGFFQPKSFARTLSMQELRTEIGIYESVVRRAIRIEIGACIVVAFVFFAYVLWLPTPLLGKIGSGLTATAALFIGWFLYRHGRVRPIPADLGFTKTVAAYRDDLARRKRLSQSYLWWYVAPLAIGPAIMIVGPQLQRPGSPVKALIALFIIAAVCGLLVLAQYVVARKTQQRIDQLSTVSEKTAP